MIFQHKRRSVGFVCFIPNTYHRRWNRKQCGCYRKDWMRASRRLDVTNNEQLPCCMEQDSNHHQCYEESTKRVHYFSANVASQRYYGASGIWGSPFFTGNRWKDAKAWQHHGSVYDWRGPGGPFNWTRRNRQQKRDTEKNRKDWYAVLGVTRNASLEQIKKAFRQKIIRIHPDVKNGLSYVNNPLESIYDLLTAYRVLRDPESRVEYDRYLEEINGHKNTEETKEENRILPLSNKQVMEL